MAKLDENAPVRVTGEMGGIFEWFGDDEAANDDAELRGLAKSAARAALFASPRSSASSLAASSSPNHSKMPPISPVTRTGAFSSSLAISLAAWMARYSLPHSSTSL